MFICQNLLFSEFPGDLVVMDSMPLVWPKKKKKSIKLKVKQWMGNYMKAVYKLIKKSWTISKEKAIHTRKKCPLINMKI